MKIKIEVYEKIISSYPKVPPENGGIIGKKDGIVCKYFHDNSSNIMDRAVYVPDTEVLNDIIEKWNENGVEFAGIIHSHIPGEFTLSKDDIEYIKAVFESVPTSVNNLFFPVIIPESNKFISYVAIRKKDSIIFIEDNVSLIRNTFT